jgi:hypothetical protein
MERGKVMGNERGSSIELTVLRAHWLMSVELIEL